MSHWLLCTLGGEVVANSHVHTQNMFLVSWWWPWRSTSLNSLWLLKRSVLLPRFNTVVVVSTSICMLQVAYLQLAWLVACAHFHGWVWHTEDLHQSIHNNEKLYRFRDTNWSTFTHEALNIYNIQELDCRGGCFTWICTPSAVAKACNSTWEPHACPLTPSIKLLICSSWVPEVSSSTINGLKYSIWSSMYVAAILRRSMCGLICCPWKTRSRLLIWHCWASAWYMQFPSAYMHTPRLWRCSDETWSRNLHWLELHGIAQTWCHHENQHS